MKRINRWPATRTCWIACLVALTTAALIDRPSQAATRVEIQRLVVEEALNSRVPPSLAMAVAKVESDFQEDALSPAGARGVMQIMPATGRGEFGVQPDELWDARLNVQLGIDFLEQLIERYDGRWDLALSHYNGGSIRTARNTQEPLPVTRKYIGAVLDWERVYAQQATVWNAELIPQNSWVASRTRVAQPPEDIAITPDIVESIVPDYWPAPVAGSASKKRTLVASDLDDFAHSIEERRMRVRSSLDDFTPAIVWQGE